MDKVLSGITQRHARASTDRDAAPFAILPPESVLDMPSQDFAARAAVPERRHGRGYWVPRAAVFAGAGIMTLAFAHELYGILTLEVMTPIQFVFLILSTISFCWIALGSLSAALGFLPLFAGERPDTLKPPGPHAALNSRTALLFPVYHEDPARIAGTIEAMATDLDARGRAAAFDIFVLSDTRGDDNGEIEAMAYAELRSKLASTIAIFYRRRRNNTARKAGNIKDWVERFGGAYEHFIILDADSLMSGDTLIQLTAAMEREPKSGLIQTVPRLVGGSSVLQHLQQYACNIYGPSVAAGLAFWHRDQGNYWGHNAIIRTQAFASAAGLPDLPGRAPFGGHILSHDFVEAVLLQRAGWGVHMMPTLDGTFEGLPPNIIDVVVRDRRWAQGNLQHLAIVSQPGLTAMGRVHLGMGVCSYVISAVWALSLIVGIVLALQGQQILPSYFEDSRTLFPIWPVFDPGAALRLFLATILVVLLPKLLGLMLELKRVWTARERFGTPLAFSGVLIETVFSVLISPILMVTQTVGVIEIFLGRDSGWKAQRRGDALMTFGDAMWFARWHLGIGIVFGWLAWLASPGLFAWMLPVIAGLLLAGPVTWLTSRIAPKWLALLLSTPESRNPAPILKQADALSSVWQARLAILKETHQTVAIESGAT